MPSLADEQFVGKVIAELNRHVDIDFGHYRPATLARRISNRMVRLTLEDPSDYLKRLRSDPEEPKALIDVLAITVSRFFRTAMLWDILAREILPSLLERKQKKGGRDLRIWSAGCASGEEAYSLAILLDRLSRKEKTDYSATILATDISERGLAAAAMGHYSLKSLEETPFGIVREYFTPVGDKFELQERIRRRVCFSRDDLSAQGNRSPVDSIFGSFDLIMCRNVMIYFDRELQKQVFEKLLVNLSEGGFLVLGRSEQLPERYRHKLSCYDNRAKIYVDKQQKSNSDKEIFHA